MIYKIGRYTATDIMSELICDNYTMLQTTSRFGIALGFGDDTIEEVCKANKIDTDTFLAIVNLLISSDKEASLEYNKSISPSALVEYLHKSHAYFLDFRFPNIRRQLKEALCCNDDSINIVIINYYDEYIREVQRHMMYEENQVFPYVKCVIEGKSDHSEYSIETFSKYHDNINAKLTELKNILVKYYPAENTNELNSVLFDIFSCEDDLASHNLVEDYLLIPTIKRLEQTNKR